jgi:hypothetical protein
MKRSHAFRITAALLAAVPLLWLAPPAAWSQDLEFDEDDTLIDSDELIFDEEDTPVLGGSRTGPPRTTGLVIPSEFMDPGTAELISDLIVEELRRLPNVQPVDYLGLRDEFDIMGAELARECAFDPVCLGRVAEDVGLDEIVIGRATGRRGAELQLVLDRIDARARSVLRYRPVRVDDNVGALQAMVRRQLPYLYGLQPEQTNGGIARPTGKTPLQLGLAWTSLGLGVAALVTGVVFGLSANSAESDVTDSRLLGNGARDLTQVEADALLADGADDALVANVLFGTGVALIGVAVLLFLITPGSDIDAEADQRYTRDDRLVPRVGASVTADGWGVFGQIRF